MYNYFTDTSEGRSLVINTRTTILGKVILVVLLFTTTTSITLLGMETTTIG